MKFLPVLAWENLVRTLTLYGNVPSQEVIEYLRDGIVAEHGLTSELAHTAVFDGISAALGLPVEA